MLLPIDSELSCTRVWWSALRVADLVLKFGVELAAIAPLAYGGASLDGSLMSAVMMALAPAAMIALWGRLAAPRANGRLSISARIPFELTILPLAAVALLAAGEHAYAAVIASAVLLNALLLTALGQREA